MTPRALLFATALAVQPAIGATAAETVLDDSRSPRQQLSADFEWLEDGAQPGADPVALFLMHASVSGVEYRLDTSAHVGQRARIFLEFPRGTAGLERGGGASMSWRARGGFADGAVEQGGRALVFDGVVEATELRPVFDFTLVLDARDLTGPLRLAPLFVLETR